VVLIGLEVIFRKPHVETQPVLGRKLNAPGKPHGSALPRMQVLLEIGGNKDDVLTKIFPNESF
jgi:hypothetical protein